MSEENKFDQNDNTEKKFEGATDNFENEAKSSARDFKEGWNQTTQSTDNKKLIAGILAIVLGALGIHKFILGYNKEGVILLVTTLIGIVTTCILIGSFILMATGIIGLIEGIIYLSKSDEEFYNTYQVGRKPWF